MEWSLEEGDVSEDIEESPRLGIALQATPAPGQQHKRKIRPFRLPIEPIGQGTKVASSDRLLGDHGKTRTRIQHCNELRHIFRDLAVQPGFGQQAARYGSVPTLGRE